MLCQPANYAVVIRESLNFAIDQMRDILEIPICEYDQNGKPIGKINTSLANLKFRIAEKLHTLVHGAVVQKNINVNIGSDQKLDEKMGEMMLTNNIEELQRRLRDLEKRDRLKPKEIDVEVIVESAGE
jgi:hypothetical protein